MMRARFLAAVAAAPLVLFAAPEPDAAQLAWPVDQPEGWPECQVRRDESTCPVLYLDAAIRGGDAVLSVDQACTATWRHEWGRADAHQTIRQWLDTEAEDGTGAVCIPLGRDVDEIVVTSLGGHCGYEDSEANAPGAGSRLRRGGASRLTLTGCHARIGTQRFGGIALRFADAYGLGDSYAEGHFYGIYDGFGRATVGSTGASVFQIAEFNTFHYRIQILAGGSIHWRQAFPEENDQ
jgi:hypothetical protein